MRIPLNLPFIEPSVQGGAKISRAISALIDPGQRVPRSAVLGES